MLKLTRKLLLGIASTLHRYASSIEKYLARENSSTNHSIFDYSDERPPAHWLAKVRQGAPQLLENYSGDDTQAATYSFETKNTFSFNSPASTSNESSEKPPAHWIEKVRRGAPHLLDEQPLYEANTSKHIAAHELPSPRLTRNQKVIHEGNSVYDEVTAKQSSVAETKPDASLRLSNDKLPDRSSENISFDSLDNLETNHLSTEIQHNPTQLNGSPSQAEEYGFRKMETPLSDNKLSSISEKEITKNKAEFKQTGQSKSPVKYAKTKPEISYRNRQLSIAQLDTKTSGTSTENKKYSQQSCAPHEQFTITNRMRIKRNSHEKNKAARQFPNITIKPRNSASINAFKQYDFNETAAPNAPNSDNRASPSLLHKHKASKQLRLNRQLIDTHLSKATDNAAENISFKSSQKKHPISIPKTAEPFKSSLTHWPNLPGEKERRLPDDRWPELPENKTPELDKIFQPVTNFAQLQKAIRRYHQSELEQRGIFWNG